jgi:ribosomal protein L37AE/L43A
MPDVIEAASSGRAKCRGCGNTIDKGTLRFGERAPNPFAEGESEVTYWFHVRCAAYRRPERFVALTPEQLEGVEDVAALVDIAKQGVEHHRLPRITGVERAKSGRAKCRHCKEAIAGGEWRFVLTIWQEARFEPMGFAHVRCAAAYFGTANIEPWVRYAVPDLPAEDLAELRALWST